MKKTLLLIIGIFSVVTVFAQVAINTDGSSADASAMLEVKSTTKGMLVPRVTNAQMNSITEPANSLLVFNTDSKTFCFFDNSKGVWVELSNTDNTFKISDTDKDTYITVEEHPDDDTIRFFLSGTEKMRLTSKSLEQLNNGGSVFIGEGAGVHDDLSNNKNIFIGDSVGFNNIEGDKNTAVGHKALFLNETGTQNAAYGFDALYSNNSGYENTATGFDALSDNTTGSCNTSNGYGALSGNTTTVTASNTIHIGNTSITEIAGQVAFSTYSDKRFKKKITPQEHGLDFIMKLKPVTYNWDIDKMNKFLGVDKRPNDASDNQEAMEEAEKINYTGFLAQDVEEAAKEIGMISVEWSVPKTTVQSIRFAMPSLWCHWQGRFRNSRI